MGCACNDNKPAAPEPTYEVTYPNGERKLVTGEHAAKVAKTMGPAGTEYSKL
jgi:hypothetical protein